MRALRLSVLLISALSANAIAQPNPASGQPVSGQPASGQPASGQPASGQLASGAKPAKALKAAKPAKPGKLDLPSATAALVGADLPAAAKAAAALGASTSEAAHGALRDGLATGLHPDVLVAAITSMATTATKTDLQIIAAYTRYRNSAVRAAALQVVLASSGDAAMVTEALKSSDGPVRAVAAEAAGRLKLEATIPALLILLDKGEDAAAISLGHMANEDLARTVAEHFGTAPDATLAKALGAMLARPQFGTEPVRLETVRTVIKLAGAEATNVLEAYVKATPATPLKQSRREAEAALAQRLGGDK